MQIILYKNSADRKVVDKSSFITEPLRIDATSAQVGQSVNRPRFIFKDPATAEKYNYAYIPDWGRYYFILPKTWVGAGEYQKEFKCDVLMTYRMPLLQQTALIDRQEKQYNKNTIDTLVRLSSCPKKRYINFTAAADSPKFDVTSKAKIGAGSLMPACRYVMIYYRGKVAK